MSRILLRLLLPLLLAANAFAATYTINTVVDGNDGTCDATHCTLREAIHAANGAGGGTIVFGAGSGLITITLASPLPDLTAPVILDGTTQPGYAGDPIVRINGVAGSHCLVVRSGNTTIRGLDLGVCEDGVSVIADNVALTNLAFERNFIGTRLGTAPINRRAISLDTLGTGTIDGVTIGNATPAGRNVLSTFGFAADALYIGGNTSNVTVAGNYFGLADDGTPLLTAARFISDIGIYATAGSSNLTIGGATAAARNVFGSGGGTQINIKIDSRHTNLRIEGNYIGTDPAGMVARRATNFAVWFFGEGQGLIRNNLITAGNTAISRGVTTTGAVTVQGNWINFRSDGTPFGSVPAAAINDFSSATGYTIGGPNPGDGNVIANYSTGISVNSPGALVQGNILGLDPTGANFAGGGTRGIQSSFARIEPGVFIRDNRVAGFATGIDIGSEALVTIDGNFIGTDATGTIARGNTVGLQISNAAGRATVANNVIAGNVSHGVNLATTTMPVTMTGNRIGVSATGTPLPNGGDGIRVVSGTALRAIGTAAGTPNTIAYNLGNGITIAGGSATSIARNSIFANAGLAIDLGANGVTANDAADADSGPNGLQNAPVLTAATTFGATTTILGTLNASPNTTYAIELYTNTTTDPSGFGEAEMFLTRFAVTTDATGNVAFTTNVAPIPGGTAISATATNLTTNDTSEMSANAIVSSAVVQFSAATANVSESGTSITLTVTRTGGTGSTTTVEYTPANGTATAGSDYDAVSGTLTFGPSDSSKTIVIPIASDTSDEADETFTLTLANVIGGNLGSPATETITITDDDDAPALSVSNTSAIETNGGTTSMAFDVTLSASSEQPVSVDYTTADGTATSGSDYGARFGTLTFAPGQTLRTVTITVNGDVAAEADETLQLVLSSPVAASIATGTATGTILNDDGNPSISIGDATILESSSSATLVLTLSNPSSSAITADFGTLGNTASSGSDFTSTTSTVTFAPGVTTQTITIPILGDTIVEGNETFFVDLTNPTNATIADAQATATIVDDDGSPALTISDLAVNESAGTANVTVLLAPASAQTVSVDWTAIDGTATAGTDFTAANGTLTFTPGQIAQTIVVTIAGDNVSEAAETFTIALSAPSNATIADADATVTIIDDDPTPTITVADLGVAEGSTATFNVTLSNASASAVTVNYATSHGTAGAADSSATSGTLTFAPGEVAKLVNVATTADTLQEPDETFFLDLSSATNAVITRPRATATITDDDGTPALLIGDATVTEGDSGAVMASFDVTLVGNAAQTVTVDYAVANGTAIDGADYAAASGTLVFTPGTTTRTISVPVIGDALVEADETFFVNLSNVTNATISDNQALGTITDDDVAPVIPTIAIAPASVAEGDSGTATMTFNVTLLSATTIPISVNYTTSDGTAIAGSDYAAASGTLVFAPGVTLQSIAIAVAGDTNVESNETFTVQLSSGTSATGTILDDDTAPVIPTISIAPASVAEGESGTATMTFNVTLSAATTIPITVNYTTSDGSAIAGVDYAAASGTLVFAPGVTSQSIAIAVAGDTNVESNETFTVQLSSGASATGTILDDDTAPVIPTISIAPASVAEGDSGTAAMTFNVTLSSATTIPINVNYSTSDGSAIAGVDYAAASGTLVFAPGVTSQSIAIAVAGDTNVESNETFTVQLSSGASATGTILDDDTAPVIPTISIAPASVAEGDSGTAAMTFNVTLSAATTVPINVNYSTSDGSAIAGVDYAAASGTLVFAPGVTSQSIAIAVAGDTNVESNETFTVQLSSGTSATGTILDDDTAPVIPTISIAPASVAEGDSGTATMTFNVTLSAATTIPINVNYTTSDGTAIAGSDYAAASGTLVFAPGVTSQSIAIAVAGDTNVEPNETFTVQLSSGTSATGTIVNDDDAAALPSLAISNATLTEGNAGTRAAVFNVTLDAPSTSTVRVNFTTKGVTATAGTDFVAANGTLTFAPGVTAQTITVGILGDSLVEPDETFDVKLSGAVNADLRDATGRGTIVDDDNAAAPTVTIDDVDVTEGQPAATFTIKLSAPSAQATQVTYETGDGTAKSGSDYLGTNGTIVFAAGETTRTIEIALVDDAVVESDETFTVALSTGAHATARIHDDDGGVAAVLAIGGAGPGNFGSFFRTVIQMHNAADVPSTGNLIVRPMGGGEPRTFGYALAARETRDLTATLDVTGFITADLVSLTGAVPHTSVRVFNDAGAEGRNGFTATFVPVSKAIGAGRHGVLIAPDDAASTRMNVGIRSLANGAAVTLTLRRANGDVAAQTTQTLGANVLVHIAAAVLFQTAIESNDAIEVLVTEGSAIVYGSSVDNVTQDSSFTIAEPIS